MRKIAFVWPSFTGDSLLFEQSVRSVRYAMNRDGGFDASYFLLDDFWHPVASDVTKRFLRQDGARRIVTTYRRGRQILGGESIAGQVQGFVEAAEKAGLEDADFIAKIDSDTMIFNTKWLHEIDEDETAVMGGCADIRGGNVAYLYGLVYLIRAKMLKPLLADIRKYPAHFMAWEDYEVTSRVFRLADGRFDSVHRFLPLPECGFPLVPLSSVNDSFVKGNAVNFAWDYNTTPDRDRQAYRARVYEAMKRLNDVAESEDSRKAKAVSTTHS